MRFHRVIFRVEVIMADYNIFGGYNRHENVTFDSQDLVNWYMRVDPKGKKRFAFFNTPGLKKLINLATGDLPIRALFVPEFDYSFIYVVAGYNIYKLNKDFVGTLLNGEPLETDSGPVSITSNNNNEIIFVDGKHGYLYKSKTSSFSKITAEGFPAFPANVVFLDGFFVIPEANSRTFQISGLNDGSTWQALNEAQIGRSNGINVGVGIVNQRLHFFKNDEIEVWYNAGYADFPFRNDRNAIFNFGCIAAASIISEFGYLFWLSKDKSGASGVYMTQGQTPIKISTQAIDDLLSDLKAPEDVRAWIYKDDGHIFYKLNWTTDNISISYDLTTSGELSQHFWFREEMEKHKGDPDTRHLADCHAYFQKQHIVGSYKNSTLYEYSRAYAMNDQEPIRRERTGVHVFDSENYHNLQIDDFKVDFEAGIGANDGIYQNPQAYLSISRDGGRSFGNDMPAPMGKIGERKQRTIWRRLGVARDFVPRIRVYDSVIPTVLLGASIDYRVLSR